MTEETPPPEVVRQAQAWGLELIERTHTRYSHTWFAIQDGRHVVLKVGDGAARRREAAALRAYAGGPATPVACRLLAEADGALLLERILLGDDLRPLAASDDDAATAAAGEVYARMHRAVAGLDRPPDLPELRDVSVAFDIYWARPDVGDGNAGSVGAARGPEPLPRRLVGRAEAMFAELAVPAADDNVLHGDAHHQNLIRDGMGTPDDVWRVIDPHGWWGDPTFDAVSLMLNLHGSLALSRRSHDDLRAQAHRRAAILAEVVGLDRERLLDWTFVAGIVAELWCLEDHGFVQGGPLRLAEALAQNGNGRV